VKKRTVLSVNQSEQHASASDFCQLFQRNAGSLYQLAYVLTGSSKRAEESLVLALDDCFKAKVFKPWASSWSRLALIERALKFAAQDSDGLIEGAENGSTELQAVLQLKSFDRFVYVLSVLEKYSVKDCAILLKASKREVMQSKVRALNEVTAFIGVPLANVASAVQLTA
jgi:hypothetical protein